MTLGEALTRLPLRFEGGVAVNPVAAASLRAQARALGVPSE